MVPFRRLPGAWALFALLATGAMLYAVDDEDPPQPPDPDDPAEPVKVEGGAEWVPPPFEIGDLLHPKYTPPPPGTLPNTAPDCAWSWTYRLPLTRDKHSVDCSDSLDSCHADSWATAAGAYIAGHGNAFDKSIWASASTASTTLSIGFLHLWRTDDNPCGSTFRLSMFPAFRADGKIDPPATAIAGGVQDLLSGATGVNAHTEGVLTVSSQSGGGNSISLGPFTVGVSSSNGTTDSRIFSDAKVLQYASRVDTLAITGVSLVSDTANLTITTSKGEANSGLPGSQMAVAMYAVCARPCTKWARITIR